MLRGELPSAPIARTLDFQLIEVGDGRAVFQGTPGPAHLNPMGTVHGGWYATLLDSALAGAVQSKMPPGRAYTTAELGVNLVKAIGPKVQRVRAEGRVLHSGRQLATAEARLVGPGHPVRARHHHVPGVRAALSISSLSAIEGEGEDQVDAGALACFGAQSQRRRRRGTACPWLERLRSYAA